MLIQLRIGNAVSEQATIVCETIIILCAVQK